jgi:hypothetical protein
MVSKNLIAVVVVAVLGLAAGAAKAQGFEHRDAGFHQTVRYDNSRHGHKARHHHRHHNHHFNGGHR